MFNVCRVLQLVTKCTTVNTFYKSCLFKFPSLVTFVACRKEKNNNKTTPNIIGLQFCFKFYFKPSLFFFFFLFFFFLFWCQSLLCQSFLSLSSFIYYLISVSFSLSFFLPRFLVTPPLSLFVRSVSISRDPVIVRLYVCRRNMHIIHLRHKNVSDHTYTDLHPAPLFSLLCPSVLACLSQSSLVTTAPRPHLSNSHDVYDSPLPPPTTHSHPGHRPLINVPFVDDLRRLLLSFVTMPRQKSDVEVAAAT